MKTLNQYLDEQLKNEEFKKEWENSKPELDVIRAIVEARISQNLRILRRKTTKKTEYHKAPCFLTVTDKEVSFQRSLPVRIRYPAV